MAAVLFPAGFLSTSDNLRPPEWDKIADQQEIPKDLTLDTEKRTASLIFPQFDFALLDAGLQAGGASGSSGMESSALAAAAVSTSLMTAGEAPAGQSAPISAGADAQVAALAAGAAGSPLSDYQTILTDVRDLAVETKDKIEVADNVLKFADVVVTVLEKIDEDAGRLQQVASGLKIVLKLVSQIGPLKPLAGPLQTLIGQVEHRAEDVKNASGEVHSKFSDIGHLIQATEVSLNLQSLALGQTIDSIDKFHAGLNDAVHTIESVSLPSDFDAAVAAANNAASPVTSVVDQINSVIDDVRNAQQQFSDALASFKVPGQQIVDIFHAISNINALINPLVGPLNVINAAVAPIQWALDAVDFVFNTVVSPILNPILDALGVNNLINNVLDSLHLPSIAPFAALETALGDISAAIDTSAVSDLITPLIDKVQAFVNNTVNGLVLGPASHSTGDATDQLLIGDDGLPSDTPYQPGTQIDGLGGADFIAGGLGDDTLNGGDGNDVLIGGAGNDMIDGGAGTDGAVLLGNFRDFRFKVLNNGSTLNPPTLVATEEHVTGSNELQGTDTITGVEKIIFLDRTIDIASFNNFFYSNSTSSHGDTVFGTAGNDFIFGNTGLDLLKGLGGDDYIEGGNETDTLRGGGGNDWLDGGPGNDVLIGGPGIDVASYANESNTPNYVALTTDTSRTPFHSSETLSGIENLVGGIGQDWFWGNNGANRIESGDNGDRINGFGGNDLILAGAGQDQIVGGAGNDTADGGADYDIFVGGRGNDTYHDDGAPNLLWYGGGGTSFWSSPYVATDVSETKFAGLPTLGFLPTDYATELAARVVVNVPNGRVTKFNSAGKVIGVDHYSGIPEVMGSTGNDRIIGAGSGDTLWGGDGNDTIIGGNNGSTTSGILIDGGDGNDRLDPGAGSANVRGGNGDDLLIINDDGTQTLNGGPGNDTLDFSGSDRQWSNVFGGGQMVGTFSGDISPVTFDYRDKDIKTIVDAENFIGSRFDDAFAGNNAVNVLDGQGGNDDLFAGANTNPADADTLLGGDGNDQLVASTGNDYLNGGAGDDRIVGGSMLGGQGGGTDTMIGAAGNDTFVPTTDAVQLISGGPGTDLVDLSPFISGVTASLSVSLPNGTTFNGIENMRGSGFADMLTGNGRANKITGEGGDDTIYGGHGDDLLHGNDGNDALYGGGGNDLLFGNAGANTLDGGAGTDAASFAAVQTGDDPDGQPNWMPALTIGTVVADLAAGTATFTRTFDGAVWTNTLMHIENLIGNWEDDRLLGNNGANNLAGGDKTGNDYLNGRGGDDVLSGGGGRDTLHGGDGADTIDAGQGADLVVAGSGSDSVTGGTGNDKIFDGLDIAALTLNPGAKTDQYAEVSGYAMPTGSITLEWLFRDGGKFDPSVGYEFLSYAVAGSGGDNEITIFAPANGNIEIWFNNTAEQFQTDIPVVELMDGAAHRMSVSYDTANDRIAFYIDGKEAASTTSLALAGVSAGGTLIFGQEQDSVGGAFDPVQILKGDIADIRVWNDVRSAAEINAHAFGELAHPRGAQGLVSNWQADAGDKTSIVDATGGPALNLKTVSGTGKLPGVANIGSGGNDTFDGGAGNDWLYGGAGRDTLIGGPGHDTLDGGPGHDTGSYASATSSVVASSRQSGRQ